MTTPLSVSHQLVSFSWETQKKRPSKGLFPDFQLHVHMHCPGQVLIHWEMKRKKINSFYMNAQQAVLVCACTRIRAERLKWTIAVKKHTLHCMCIYMHMTTILEAHLWVSSVHETITTVVVRARTCNLLKKPLPLWGWESWAELATTLERFKRSLD